MKWILLILAIYLVVIIALSVWSVQSSLESYQASKKLIDTQHELQYDICLRQNIQDEDANLDCEERVNNG